MIGGPIRRRILSAYLTERIRALLIYGHFRNDGNWEVKDAGEKGMGLFSTTDRPRGSIVFIATGPVRHARFCGQDCYLYPDWYGVDEDTWIEILDPYVRANHSCEPNLGLDGSRVFIARRDIAAGEELTYDYSVTDDELDWVMEKPCSCGSQNCRREIGSIQSLTRTQYDAIFPYVPKHMRRVYEEHSRVTIHNRKE